MNTHVKLPAPLRPPAKIPSRLVWPATVPAQNSTWINPLSGLWSDGTIASGSGFTSNFTTLDLADDATNHLDSPPHPREAPLRRPPHQHPRRLTPRPPRQPRQFPDPRRHSEHHRRHHLHSQRLPNRILNLVQGTVNFSHATLHLSSLITPTSANVHITAANSTVEIDDAGWYHGGLRVGWGNGNTSRALLSLDDAAVVNTGGIDLGETDFTFGQLNVRHAAHTNTW